jgi:predicted lipoprotein with Yx(FWY)xxD motif
MRKPMVSEPARRVVHRRAAVGSVIGKWLGGHVWVPVLSVFGLAGLIAALLVVSLSPSSTSSPGPSVGVADSGLGKLLVDRRRLTLYVFTHDGPNTSVCSEACARVWPPATISGKPTAAPGLSTAKLKTIKRPDNTRQLVYNGHPLYTFSEDTRSGQLGGENYLSAWYVISPAGQLIGKPGSVSTPAGY